MNYSLNVKSSSIVHTLLSNCVKLLGKVQKLLIKCISYSVISKRIRVVSPKFYTARKNFTGPPVPTNFKSARCQAHLLQPQKLLESFRHIAVGVNIPLTLQQNLRHLHRQYPFAVIT